MTFQPAESFGCHEPDLLQLVLSSGLNRNLSILALSLEVARIADIGPIPIEPVGHLPEIFH